MNQPMFSESWHRIGSHRAWLQPSVQVQRQTYRGRIWHVLRDPFSNQFFRLPPAAYQFIARLSPAKTIEQVWRECLHFQANDAPGQEEVVRLLSQLTQANLIVSDLPPDTTALFERSERTKEKELKGKLINFLFMKFQLFDPDWILTGALPFCRPFLSRWGALLWFVVVITAVAVTVQNWDSIFVQGQGLLAPENLFLLYICGVVVKLWHEFGHGILCRRFGGEVRAFGVMLLVLTPLPFVDATSSWSFRHRWQRMLVASGGMIFELFIASLAVFVWAWTGRGMVNSLAYNIMVLASVTTLAFNANPLLRFDGYYIFSDLIEIPNLNHRAIQQLRFYLERYVYGCFHSIAPALTTGEAVWLTAYGVSSGLYRIFLIGVILLVVAQHFFAFGLLLAAVCFVLWILGPIYKFLRYLWTDPSLERRRTPAIQRTAAFAGIVLAFLLLVPFPHHFRAEGIVQARQYSRIYTGYAGQIQRVLVPSGTAVKAGTPLIALVNPELDLELDSAHSKLRGTQAKLNIDDSGEARAVTQGNAGELQAIRELIVTKEKARDLLTVVAPHDGVWVCPQDNEMPGGWVDRGTEVGEVIDPTQFNFTAIIPQQYADTIFAEMRGAQVRLHGQAGHVIRGLSETVIPGKQDVLPSAALGWKGGGPVEVEAEDNEGLHASTPFFEVEVLLPPRPPGVLLAERATGEARFDLPAESLFFQWMRALRQLMLSRLQV